MEIAYNEKNFGPFRFCYWKVSIYRVSGGNVPDFGRMFLQLKYTNITQNTYVRS